jgi:hypothetical protein
MPEKAFRDFEYMDDELEQAVLHATGGVEPDNFVESSFGAAVTGPPDPKTEPEERALTAILSRNLAKHASDDGGQNGGLRWD